MAAAAATVHAKDVSGEYSPAVRLVILIAIMLSTILEVLDTSIVNVAIPDMQGNLGATVDQINWVSTGYILANVIILPLTGWLSNYFGRRLYLAGSILLFTAASLLCGTSTTLNMLVFFRILQGAGGAALLSTAQATLIEVFPRKQLPMVQALFSMGLVAAPTFGPTVGGFITDSYNWRWIFFINIPIGILAGFLVLTFLQDSKYQTKRVPIDFIGIGMLAIGLGSLQTMLEKGNRESWFESPLISGLAVSATVFLIAFVFWELKTEYPAVKLSVLKHKSFAAGSVYGMVLGFGLYGGVFILPIFLQEIQHFTAFQTGRLLLPGGLVTALSLPILGRIMGKVDPRLIVGFGSILFAISMFQLQTMNIDTGQNDLIIPLLIRGLALSCMFLPLVLTSLAGLPPQEVGYASGIFNLSRQVGGSIGIAFLTTQLDHRTAIHTVNLANHVSFSDSITQQRILMAQQQLVAKGVPPIQAFYSAIGTINASIARQAITMSFEDGFRIIGLSFLLALPLLVLLKRPKGPPSGPVDAH